MGSRTCGVLLCLTFAQVLLGKCCALVASASTGKCEADGPHQDVCLLDGEQLGTFASPAVSSDSSHPSLHAFIQSFSASCSSSSGGGSSSSSSSSRQEPHSAFASVSEMARHSSSRRVSTRAAAASQPQASEAAHDDIVLPSSQVEPGESDAASASG